MFATLLHNPQDQILPPQLQSEAARDFPDAVRKSHLTLLKCSSRIPGDSYVIVGVASYSPLELKLLDEVDKCFDKWTSKHDVYVFDVASCADQADVNRYLDPTLFSQQVEQTPILAVVKASNVVDFQQGLENTKNGLRALGLL